MVLRESKAGSLVEPMLRLRVERRRRLRAIELDAIPVPR